MSCFLRPSQPDTLAAMLSRIDRLEKDLSRSLVIEPGVGVHIPGQLTVGGGATGGGGDRLTTGAPDVVTGLALAAGGDSTSVWLDVSWTYPENSAARVVAFEIRFKRTAEDTEYGYAVTQNSAAFRLNGLVSDTGYTVAIRSLSQLGSASAWSADVALNSGADTTAPAQVGVVVVATGNKTQMGSWPSNTEVDLDHYLINVATSSAVNGAGKFTTGLVVDGKITSATVVTIDGLDGTGDQYFWQVAAVDATGNQGPYSATVNNTTTLIESAWISSLVASKITAGTIGTEILKLTNSPNSRIESFDGTSLVLKGNGELIATSATITGAIYATSGTFAGSLSAASGTFAGSLSAATGTFAGSLSAASGTFTGSLTAATGTFSGSISGASGTFTGNLSGSTITSGAISGGTIDIGGADATSFHVDAAGQHWAGSATYASAPFKVSAAGVVSATSGDFTGDIHASSFATGSTGARVTINSAALQALRFYSTTGTKFAQIAGPSASPGALSIISNAASGDAEANYPQINLEPGSGITLAPYAGDFVYVTNNFDVAGTSQLDGAVTMASTLVVSSTATVNGVLRVNGTAAVEGGEIRLDHGSSGSKETWLDNWNGTIGGTGPVDWTRLAQDNGAGTLSTLYLQLFNLPSSGSASNALHYASGTESVYEYTSSARFKSDFTDIAELLEATGAENPILDDGMAPMLYHAIDPDTGLADNYTRGEFYAGWTAEQVAEFVPEAAVLGREGQPNGVNRDTLLAYAVAEIRSLRARVDTLTGQTRQKRSQRHRRLESALVAAEPARIAPIRSSLNAAATKADKAGALT
jgi:hypothetical protein